MDVKLTQTGETITVNKSYGMRLIEQGKAVPRDRTHPQERRQSG